MHALILCTACVAMWSPVSVSWAQPSADNGSAVASEERVKAAYLHKFLNYVNWPPASFAQADAPYVIGVVDDDEVADELAKIVTGRNINNRPVAVKKLHAGGSLDGMHVLFIGGTVRARLSQWLKQAQQQPILVVTESEGALVRGSMINFKLADERVRFEIALEPVEQSGLKLNSRILAVAISVVKGPQQ